MRQLLQILPLTLGVAICSAIPQAAAQIEQIGPLVLQPQQTTAMVFTNIIPPNPLYKELQFTGFADVPAGAIAPLFIEFDYVDQNGNTVVVPAPNSLFNVIGGAPNPIDTGVLTLMFCPSVVSLHLTNLDMQGVPMNVQGSFRHQCVPEPASFGLTGTVALLLWGLRRRLRAVA